MEEQVHSRQSSSPSSSTTSAERVLLPLLTLQLVLVLLIIVGTVLLIRELQDLDRAVSQLQTDLVTVRQQADQLEGRIEAVSQRSDQLASRFDALTQGGGAAATSTPLPPIQAPNVEKLARIPRQNRVLGNPAAPLHVVVWGDYQCPACANFERQIFPQILDRFIATGQVRWEFRDLAFIGPESLRAAEAAACAEEQGKFWEYHMALYANFVGSNRGSYAETRLAELARVLDLDLAAFQSCLTSGRHLPRIRESIQQALDVGVQATPSFSINGGAPFTISRVEDLISRIEGALP